MGWIVGLVKLKKIKNIYIMKWNEWNEMVKQVVSDFFYMENNSESSNLLI